MATYEEVMAVLNALNQTPEVNGSIAPDVLDRIARTGNFTKAEVANGLFVYAYAIRESRAGVPSNPALSRQQAQVIAGLDLSKSTSSIWTSAVIILADELTDQEIADSAFMDDLERAVSGVTSRPDVVTMLQHVRNLHGY